MGNRKKFTNIYSSFFKKQVLSFVEVANKYADTTFIVGHMIGVNLMSEKLKSSNVYFDLSAPQLYSEGILKKAIYKIGCKKLILGSDSPYGKDNIEKILKRLEKLSLTKNQIKCICGENLMKILKL